MDAVVNDLTLSGAPAVVVGIVMLALGALECFLGYRIFKVQVGIICFIAGFGIGYMAIYEAFANWIPALVVGLVLAVLLCFLSVKIFKLGVFLFVTFFAFWVCWAIIAAAWQPSFWLALLLALVFGAVGAFLAKPFIIVSSAVGGAGMAVQGIQQLMGPDIAQQLWVTVLVCAVGLALAIPGMVVQFRTNKNAPTPAA